MTMSTNLRWRPSLSSAQGRASNWFLAHSCGLFALVVLCFLTATPAPGESDVRPNVLVILTDDQGWGDFSHHGNVNLKTPHLDSLARDGASFDHFYVCQVCAPTRAEFLTGRYYPRTGVSGVSRGQGRINADETTIADLFHRAGYATGAFGKWHNGTQPPLHPNDRGFDEFYGFTSGHWGHYFSPPLDHNGTEVRGDGFVVDDFTNRAIEFITSNRQGPFFCYLPLNTPHSPMMVEDRFYAKFDGVDPELRYRDPEREDVMMTRAALALCENIDWNVGRVLDCLESNELSQNTIVVFFCDNGPNSYRYNGGMKGRKGSLDEGGLRSPLFVRWPDKIRKGTRVRGVSAAIDLLPTLTSLAGVEAATEKKIDGIDLSAPLLGKDSPVQDRMIFSIKKEQVTVRTQQFRLSPQGQFFDILRDPGQRRDVAAEYPQFVKSLRERARLHAELMGEHFRANADRPFHVGFGPRTRLPARDGVEDGKIRRSSKAPNNSFFENWVDANDSISWQVEVASSGRYEVIVRYTCAKEDVGCILSLEDQNGESTEAEVAEAFDPPLYGKPHERVEKSHYFVKDFRPLSLGELRLTAGRGELRLGAKRKVGSEIVDVHSIELRRLP